MKRFILLTVATATAALFTACQPSAKSNDAAKDSAATILNDTAKVFNAYLKVKDNLFDTDGKAAKQSSEALATELDAIKGCTEAAGLARKIAATEDVKSQRLLFLQLSQDVIPLAKGMKNKQAPIYVAYCPMADEGKGGYWLSAQKEIKNPYYGNQMPDCGEVKEELK